MTETPDKGAPCSLVTLPVTVFCCATAGALTRNNPINAMSILVFMDTVYRVLGGQ